VRNGNVVFADGNLFFNRSGMTIAPTAEIIAEILHNVTFAETAGAHWLRADAKTASAVPAMVPFDHF
jgi:hypothetical protein